MLPPLLAAAGITSYPLVSPMRTRPDTSARLACEDRGMPAILAACADPAAALDACIALAHDEHSIDHYALSN